MRGQPDPNADPYRTLGLEPGASMAEVKRAYRLLAKAFHPDSAGEAAVPRFLAIQDAYERLRTGKPAAGPRSARPAPPPAPEPWRADPERARAARERARASRGGSTAGPRAAGSGGSASGASGGRAKASGPATGTRGTGRRNVRKATMGSTSYDEARDPSDATWSGASWYGPSSGEYWIVNPREYADPRKHGPEYLQRARRPLGDDAAAASAGPSVAASAEAATGSSEAPPDAFGASGTAGSASATGTSHAARAAGGAWRTSTGAARSTEAHAAPARVAPAAGAAEPGADRVEALEAASRAWLGGPADDPIRRLGLALVAWPPIGLAAAAAIGEATGCASYSAACSGSEPMLPWLAQAAILGLLLLLPPVARLLAGGAIAVLIALVPITAVLVAVGGGGAPQGGVVLAILLAVAWLVGVGWTARNVLARPERGQVA